MGILECTTPEADNHCAGPQVLRHKCASESSTGLGKKIRLLLITALDSVTLGWPPRTQVVLMFLVRDTSSRIPATEKYFQHLVPFPLALPCSSSSTVSVVTSSWSLAYPWTQQSFDFSISPLTATSWKWFYIHPPPAPSSSLTSPAPPHPPTPPPASGVPICHQPPWPEFPSGLDGFLSREEGYSWGGGLKWMFTSGVFILSQCYNTLRSFWLYYSHEMKAFENCTSHF